MSPKRAKDKALKCPDCGARLAGVYAEANYGRVLLLDQCPRCGGTWFDKWELYFLKDGSIEAAARPGPCPAAPDAQAAPEGLGALDVGAFLAGKPHAKSTGPCPVCSRALEPFRDPMLPEDASIRRCAGCSGLWLNRGGLERYAEHRAGKKTGKSRRATPPARTAPEVKAPELATLKRLQKELDASSLAEPDAPAALHLDAPPIEPREFAKDVGFLILHALLRLVFKI